MNTDICNVYRKLCLRNKIPVDESILSCLFNSSVSGELNLSNITIKEKFYPLIAESLKLVSTITILNLSDCLLSFDNLKNFLDVVNQLKQLSQLNLKGNQIENNKISYISKILLSNPSITDLQMEWNNIGASVDTFEELCNSLTSNTVLKTLNLSYNKLCQKCAFHLAHMLNINKCLKSIDLSWNCIGEAGAVLLLKSLKNNEILIKLNIKGNSASEETCIKIDEQLNHNQLNEMTTRGIQNQNLGRFNHEVLDDTTNDQVQLNYLEKKYRDRINEFKSKLHILQEENQQHKQELDFFTNNCLKEKENNTVILDQVEKVKSELSLKTQSLSSLIKQISNEMCNTDMENTNSLEDFEKVIYIIKKLKKKYVDKISKNTKMHKKLLETLPKCINELNSIKAELKIMRSSIEIGLHNYSDELTSMKELLLTNMFHLKVSNKINNEMHVKNLIEHQKDIYISEKQGKTLVLLKEKLTILLNENTDLKLKLTNTETQSIVDTQTVKKLENSLILAKETLNKFNDTKLADIAAQHLKAKKYNDTISKEIDILKMNLVEKDQQFQQCEQEKEKLIISYTNELSTLEEQLMSEKQKCEDKKKEDLKQIEELYLMFSEYINKLRKDNLECK